MRCVGDPYGGGDCLCPATHFGYGVTTAEDDRPMVVLMPACELHLELVGDWLARQNPYGDSWAYPWELFDVVRDRTAEEVGDVWVCTHESAA